METTAVIVAKGNELEVSAATPIEMLDCQQSLLEWVKTKIALVKQEATELKTAFEHAVKSKWQSGTLKRHSDLALKRVEFYEKIQTALAAGYYIVPNFPVSVFAIRTDKKKPLKLVSDWHRDRHQQPTESLAQGEAHYKNPFPVVYQRTLQTADPAKNLKELKEFYAKEWQDVEFPISMAKPHIMEAATRAMALKVFDDLGMLPNEKKADPMIIGRLKDPRSVKYRERYVSFIIAWHLDTRTL